MFVSIKQDKKLFTATISALFITLCCSQMLWAQTTQPTTKSTTKKHPQKSIATARQPSKKLQKTSFDVAALKKKLTAIQRKFRIAGMGIALVAKGKMLWQDGIGFADVAKKKKVTNTSFFRVGSISKMIVALGFLKLVEQGKVKLSDRVDKWIKDVEWKNPWKSKTPITVAHLLEHTAGFSDMHLNELYAPYSYPIYPLRKTLLKNVRSRISRYEPGRFFSYSNPGYSLATYILEKVTNKKANEWLKQQILKPLGMKKSGFAYNPWMEENLVKGYIRGQEVPYHGILHWPSGALHASPQEMGKLLLMLVRRGKTAANSQLLTSESIERMEKSKTTLAAKQGAFAGYGIGNYRNHKQGYLTQGHDGGTEGFVSNLRYFPRQNAGYVLLFNSSVHPFALHKIKELLFQTLQPFFSEKPTKKKPVKLSQKDLLPFTGNYQLHIIRNDIMSFIKRFVWVRIKLSSDKQTLIKQSYGLLSWVPQKTVLYPLGKGRFFTKDSPFPNFVFSRTKQQVFLSQPAGAVLRKQSSGHPVIVQGFVVFWVVYFLSFLLFTLYWGIRKAQYKMEEEPMLRVRVLPLSSLIALAAAFYLITGKTYDIFGYTNPYTISFAVLTACFPILSLFGLFYGYKSFQEKAMNGRVRIYCMFACLLNLGMTYLIWPIIGLRLWSY